uniref:Uncharacterized protein n=1 Tax=uncultured marine thaumarchaeote SAT1000_51_A06 TaxID=1456418 RepID=A0A075IEN4_9ARCH|nr:hypothetical protein [uncultured marine thaumarchaeote SAT1000_51_A06]
MKYLLIIFLAFTIIPAFAQEPMIGDYLEPSNPSLIIHQTEISYFEFNKVKSNAVIMEFENIHAGSWQTEFHNDLLYGNPDGDAVIRIYDSENADKFFEIGMGSHPRYSYWIAAAVPETGYVLLYSAYENGWAPGNPTKITYSEQGGLTVDNGLRTVLSNLDISPFAIKSYSVHGMKGSTDPPAVTDGVFTVKITSADYGENPLWIFPFVVTGIVGAGVIILIFSKRRS